MEKRIVTPRLVALIRHIPYNGSRNVLSYGIRRDQDLSRILQIFQNPLQMLYTLPAIIIGLTVHEWAHAYAAYRLGDPP